MSARAIDLAARPAIRPRPSTVERCRPRTPPGPDLELLPHETAQRPNEAPMGSNTPGWNPALERRGECRSPQGLARARRGAMPTGRTNEVTPVAGGGEEGVARARHGWKNPFSRMNSCSASRLTGAFPQGPSRRSGCLRPLEPAFPPSRAVAGASRTLPWSSLGQANGKALSPTFPPAATQSPCRFVRLDEPPFARFV